MKSANITWIIKEDNQDNITYDYYIGNINGSNSTSLKIQVWNNYQGFDDAKDILNAKLIFKTPSIDDSYIFDYLTVVIDNQSKALTKYSDIKRGVTIDSLSGKSNTGDESEQNKLATKNMCNIELIFNPIDYKVKEGLKNLILDIEFNS